MDKIQDDKKKPYQNILFCNMDIASLSIPTFYKIDPNDSNCTIHLFLGWLVT